MTHYTSRLMIQQLELFQQEFTAAEKPVTIEECSRRSQL